MFSSYKGTRTLSRNVWVKNLLIPYCYFSDRNNEFVKKVKALERLKANASFSPPLYEQGKYILFLKSEMVCLERNDKLMFKDFKDIENLKTFGDVTTVFLDILTNSVSEVYLFAADLNPEIDTDVKDVEISVDGKFLNMRQTLFFLSKEEAQYITQARGLLNFCKSYKFCCYCGGTLKVRDGGFQKQCTSCKFVHYPPLSPIGITLIEDEAHEEVLLVRQPRHPPGMYTCVSGFIEPGESLEENVMREVAEEVGVSISTVEYCTSQHWALPTCQLILGCIATAINKNIDIDEKEILDAKWVKAKELENAVTRVRHVKSIDKMSSDKLLVPPFNAVSHILMVIWLKKYHNFEVTSS